MGKEYYCECGTAVKAKSAKHTVRCPKCGNMLNYGEIPEETTIAADEGFAIAAPTSTWKDPVQEKPAARQPDSYGFVEEAPVSKKPVTIFEPDPGAAPPVEEKSVFEPDPKHDPFLQDDSDEGKRARRKRPKPPNPDDSLNAGWRAWINPEGLLWLPILIPCFSIATGVIAAGLRIKIGSATGMQVNPFMTVFGTILAVPFACFMILHLADIIGAWALGTKTDPEWPDIVATGMAHQTFLLIFSILAGALVGALLASPIYYLLGPENSSTYTACGIVIGIVIFLYAPIAWLATVLWEDWRAANPLLVLGAIIRLNSRLFPFYGEFLVHLLILGVLAAVTLPAVSSSVILGGFIWMIFWTTALLSGPRLARALGIVYATHYRKLEWFT